VETFKVVDPVFYEHGPGGPHYQAKVSKLGIPEAAEAVQHITYNVSGHNSRVNVGSTDNSTNTVTLNGDLAERLAELQREIETLNLGAQEKSEALEVVDAVREQISTGRPKKSVVSALLASLPHVGNVLKIATSIGTLLS
jgi:hypothetical protein